MGRAQVRIENEYQRDSRLTIEQRIEKIAIGYIGEFAFKEWCQAKKMSTDYLGEEIGTGPDQGDFRHSESGLVLDVKTQDTPYVPQDDWRCEVTNEQRNRPADIYVFAKLVTNKITGAKTLYLVGWLTREEFDHSAVFHPKGTVLRGRNVHYDKWDVTIEQLHEMDTLFNEI